MLQVCSVIGLAKISVLFMTAGSLALFGQSLSIGVKGGVRASDDFQCAATSESRRYVAGPMLEVAGRLQLAPEICYTHWNRQAIQGSFPDGPSYGSTQNQLDILLGISYRIGMRTR